MVVWISSELLGIDICMDEYLVSVSLISHEDMCGIDTHALTRGPIPLHSIIFMYQSNKWQFLCSAHGIYGEYAELYE